MDDDSSPRGTPRGMMEQAQKDSADVVHGYALAVAAMLAASTTVPLGVPSRLVCVGPVQHSWLNRSIALQRYLLL